MQAPNFKAINFLKLTLCAQSWARTHFCNPVSSQFLMANGVIYRLLNWED